MFSGTAWNNDGHSSVSFVFNIDGANVTPAITGNVHKNLEGSFPVSAQWLTTVQAGQHENGGQREQFNALEDTQRTGCVTLNVLCVVCVAQQPRTDSGAQQVPSGPIES